MLTDSENAECQSLISSSGHQARKLALWMRVAFQVALVGLLTGAHSAAQSAGPSFEVSSVKPLAAGAMKMDSCSREPAEFKCLGTTVGSLLRSAYGLERHQLISKVPLDEDFYVVTGRFPEGTADQDLVSMKRNLLAQRFGLIVHEETRQLPAYELTVAKSGHKLRTPEAAGDAASGAGPASPGPQRGIRTVPDKDGLPVLPPGKPGIAAVSFRPQMRISARMQPVSALLEMVGGEFGRPVKDKTGLTGVYDYTLTFALTDVIKPLNPAEVTDEPSDPALNITQAFGNQLGLVFKSVKSPVRVLVVDRIQRPTEN